MEFGNDVNVWKDPFLRRKRGWQGASATNSGELCREAPGHALKFRPTELPGVRMKHGRHVAAAAAEDVAGWPP
jgi:hypothetical protein